MLFISPITYFIHINNRNTTQLSSRKLIYFPGKMVFYAHHIPEMPAYIHGISKHDYTTNQLKNDHAF